MALWLYNSLLLVTSPFWGLWLVWRVIGQRKDRRGFNQRWRGLDPTWFHAEISRSVRNADASVAPRIWVHAVSVGEVMAMIPLVQALRRRYPHAVLVGSTVTDLGQETMRDKLPELDLVFYLPFDLWWSVRRTIRTISPSLFLFGETELWPNVLLHLERSGVPAILINGRVSERSVRHYRWVGGFMAGVVRTIDALAVQGEIDRTRFIQLGADPSRVTMTGNLKADGAMSERMHAESLKRLFGLGDEPLVMAGSTHDPEERLVARAFLALVADRPTLRLCLAPRHLNRVDAVDTMLRELGLTPLRRSRMETSPRAWSDPRDVVVLDTIGELADGYALATVVVMGGTFAPIGGHNLLEPAAAGCPILIGPRTGQWEAVAEGLADAGAAIRVTSEAELIGGLRLVLDEAPCRQTMGRAARDYVAAQQGATARTMTVIAGVIDHAASAASDGGSPVFPTVHRRTGALAACGDWLFSTRWAATLVKSLLAPLAWSYGAVTAIRRSGYRRGWLTAHRLSVPVVSVGNLTVGGSGKTPTVMALAQLFQSAGRAVGIVLRGYRGVRTREPLLVSDGRSLTATVEEAGDEAVLLARRLPGVPIVVGKDRAAAARLLLASASGGYAPGLVLPDLILMDDGFQHLALARDVNLLVIDAAQLDAGGWVLPCGPLRERWSAVRDASAALVTDRRSGPEDIRSGVVGRERGIHALRRGGFDGPVFFGRIRPTVLIERGSERSRPLDMVSGQRVVVCSGIGQPQPFRDLVASMGATICGVWEFDDHHRYERQELEAVAREACRLGAALVVTTEKDAVKFDVWPMPELPVVAVRILLEVEPDAPWREWLIRQCGGPGGVLPAPSVPVTASLSDAEPTAELLAGMKRTGGI